MSNTIAIPRKLWEHPQPERTDMYKFQKAAEISVGRDFKDYNALYQWSIEHRADFWRFSFQYFPIVYSGTVPQQIHDEKARMDSLTRWFNGVKMNFAENILFVGDSNGRAVISPGKEDNKIACVEAREDSSVESVRHITWRELRERVGLMSQAMKAHGVRKGDSIALVASVCFDSLTVFLAATAVGALFSSSSPDMGTQGILDRLTQSKPKFLFMDDWAVYRGRKIDLRSKMIEIEKGMRNVKEFDGIVSQPRHRNDPADISAVPRCQSLIQFLSRADTAKLEFEQLDFSDPMIILYSSGTTGKPKCILHSVGGIVLSGHKESRLQRSVDHNSIQLQYTTTGWMMYMSSVQLLLVGARTVMFDGNPFYPTPRSFLRLVAEENVTHLGISPRYMQTLRLNGVIPREVADLCHLKVVTSTGMVLSDDLFEWFYDTGFPPAVQLANISGGTDIAAAFGTANPLLPLYVGGCQCIALGMAVEVYDAAIEGGRGIKGRPVPVGTPGELVCTKSFPTMPTKFLGIDGPTKYFNSYFEKYDGVWTHGDFVLIHPHTKQFLLLGRADGVLNPSGVRFGSSDIYSVIDAAFPNDIEDSICVGQRRPKDDDESVMLFLQMKPGKAFTSELVEKVKAAIRKSHSPRHVPKYVFETPEIPTTINLKKVELPVKQIVSGQVIKPSETLANPHCLEYYYQFAKDENLGPARARL